MGPNDSQLSFWARFRSFVVVRRCGLVVVVPEQCLTIICLFCSFVSLFGTVG